jgi:hypothetical protein
VPLVVSAGGFGAAGGIGAAGGAGGAVPMAGGGGGTSGEGGAGGAGGAGGTLGTGGTLWSSPVIGGVAGGAGGAGGVWSGAGIVPGGAGGAGGVCAIAAPAKPSVASNASVRTCGLVFIGVSQRGGPVDRMPHLVKPTSSGGGTRRVRSGAEDSPEYAQVARL